MAITFEDIVEARRRLGDNVVMTTLAAFREGTDPDGRLLYLKMENLQHTGSFKARGSLNKLMTLSDNARQKGVITASTGNHQALE